MPTIRRPHRPLGRAGRLTGLGFAMLLAASQAASPARAATDPQPAAPSASAGQAVDAHIASLHRQLAITPAQEKLWGDFTAVMRTNAQQIQDLLAARKAQFGTMNAVSDLQSYADFTAKRSSELAALVPPFTALYDAMSPSQKATADRVFRNNTDRGVRRAAPPK